MALLICVDIVSGECSGLSVLYRSNGAGGLILAVACVRAGRKSTLGSSLEHRDKLQL